MYEYIQGKLAYLTLLKAVVESHGVGYKITVPASFQGQDIGSSILLYVSHVVREDSQTLYGFITRQERDLFEKILGVSGIGPKTALALVGHLDIAHLEAAVINNDTRLISKVPGIGKKTAERLIIEMRDKIKGLAAASGGLANNSADRALLDAISALISLGYNPQQAQLAIKKVREENQKEEDPGKLITLALRKL